MRVCSRTGCGVNLLKPDGVTPDYSKRRFCSRECKSADLRQKMRDLRAKVKDYIVCHECGQKVAYDTDVSRNKAPQSDLNAVEGDW